MKPTMQYILDKALALFNGKGFVNVRLQHIDDSAFVSVVHLVYYFKNKENLILPLYKRLKKKQELLPIEFRVLPFLKTLIFITSCVPTTATIFFYLDTLEL